MFLLDTMVLSEPGKRIPRPEVMAWFGRVRPESLFVSTITFGEIAGGIARKRTADPGFLQRLQAWSDKAQQEFLGRTLPVTTAFAVRWGELYVRLKRRDIDLLIAATALEHDLTVVTRNVRHFQPTGVKLLNPYGF